MRRHDLIGAAPQNVRGRPTLTDREFHVCARCGTGGLAPAASDSEAGDAFLFLVRAYGAAADGNLTCCRHWLSMWAATGKSCATQ